MSTVIDTSGKGRNVGTNIWLGLLVLSLLVFGANTAYSITKAQRLGGASSAASNLQVNSQRLANQGREAVAGDTGSFAAFKDTKAQIDRDVEQPGPAGPDLQAQGGGLRPYRLALTDRNRAGGLAFRLS